MSSRAMVDLDAINNELLSRGIHFHVDRVKTIRRELNRLAKRVEELEANEKRLTERVMNKQKEILEMHNNMLDLREQFKGPTCYR